MTSNRSAARPHDQLAEELAAIKAMSRAVNATLSLDDIATAALSEIVDAVRPDLAFLFLRDGDRLNLTGVAPPAARRRLGDIPEHRVGECLCGLAVREKQSLFSHDIFADRRCAWDECRRAGITSFAAIPLIHGNDAIGVVGLASETERDFGGRGDFLETLAGLVASALVNARLYETAQRELAERTRATDLLHESEERLRLAITAANQGLYDLNVQTGETVVSAEYATMLGYDPTEFHETNAAWIERLHPDDREAVASVYRDYVAGKLPEYRVEFRQRTRAGDWKWILSLGKIVERDATGQPLRMLGTHTDITDRKQAEEELYALAARRQALLDAIPDIVMEVDARKVYTWANQPGIEFFGYDAIGREAGYYFEGEQRTYDQVKPLFNGSEQVVYLESWQRRRDGQKRLLAWWCRTLKDEQGRVAGAISSARDITELKQAEDALRASLEEKVVLLKEVHHRVKNNLQIVSSLLNLQAGKVQNPEVQDLLRDTQGRIRAMAVLHETLYASGSLARVNIRKFAQTISSQVARNFLSDIRDIRLLQDVADVMLPLDQAVPVGLVLNELLSNALKHAFANRAGGEITVQLQVAADGYYVLRVADDGVGLSGGSGVAATGSIGLLLVEGLVRQLEGELTVSQEAGTTFQIVFPIQPA